MKEKQAPKIEIDKHAIRFTFSNGNGLNLLWRDLFCPKNHHQSFQDNILFAIERCFRECVLYDVTPEFSEEDE